MIKINRSRCPAYLQKPNDQFQEHDCDNPGVKTSLSSMQYRKCCYCERHIDFGDGQCEIEHYVPKSYYKDNNGNIQWHLANKWENLLIACRDCNFKKRSQLPINEATRHIEIVDPSDPAIDPEEHIDFTVIDGHFICMVGKNGSIIGESTVNKLKFIERMDLRREYNHSILEIDILFQKLAEALLLNRERDLTHLINELCRVMSADAPYTAFHRNYIAKKLNTLNQNQIPQLELHHKCQLNRVTIDFPRGFDIRP